STCASTNAYRRQMRIFNKRYCASTKDNKHQRCAIIWDLIVLEPRVRSVFLTFVNCTYAEAEQAAPIALRTLPACHVLLSLRPYPGAGQCHIRTDTTASGRSKTSPEYCRLGGVGAEERRPVDRRILSAIGRPHSIGGAGIVALSPREPRGLCSIARPARGSFIASGSA